MTVSVLIASMGRESLLRTLQSIEAATLPAGQDLEVVVADDSPDQAVPRLIADRYPQVRVVDVNAQNVSRARNACLDAARGDWLIFVDDDEHVEPDWLVQHLAVAEEYAADAVFGPVYHLYPESAPDWFRAADPLFQDWRWSETGRRIDHGRTGNTLIRRTTLDRLGLRFDDAFGKAGGEDDDFFRRMAARGAKLIVTDRPKAYETVEPERANAGYILRRQTRFGQTHALIALRQAGAVRRAAFGIEALAKLGAAWAGFALARPFNRARAFRMQMKSASNLGKLRALAGARLGSSWS
jgi:succinoglycan biosynthesis protein ExoM